MFMEVYGRGQYIDVDKLKKTPITPYEGMKFADDYFMPLLFRHGMYHVHLAFICSIVRKCLPIRSAFKTQKISEDTYFRWKRIYKKEKEMYEDTEFTTPMIMFFDAIYDAEAESETALVNVMMDSAVDEGNTDYAKYLLDKRHKWKETTSVEVDTAEDKSIAINIAPMEDGFAEEDDDE